MEKKNCWLGYSAADLKELNAFAEDYKAFISTAKTERLCVDEATALAKAAGFRDLDALIQNGDSLKAGDRFYAAHMGKTFLAGIIGTDPIEEGVNILGAHIDSPRLDVKQTPLYEDTELAYFDTHYYGGIKKYQWVTIPLAIYGVVAKKDGTVVNIAIGDKEDDPVFCVSDLLIHLADKQMQKKASLVVEGEALDLLLGSRPLPTEKADGKADAEDTKERVKAGVLKILKEQYDIEEEDFISAELEIVPAGKARDLGFDRSMIIGYGQDDRVCAYPSLRAILDTGEVKRTSLCILTDKEEIGSVGATGAESRFFDNSLAELMNLTGSYSELALRRALKNSAMLSSDVSAAYDPLYPEVFDKAGSAYFGKGVAFEKYTGSRGKSGSNDASAEFIGKLRRIMDDAGVGYQFGELGKVDAGGGGTIAYILANFGMNVIDSGVSVLCMHSPWEVASKSDIYEAYKAYKVFVRDMTR